MMLILLFLPFALMACCCLGFTLKHQSSTTNVHTAIAPALDVMEEAERKEMSWLVKSTSRLLGGKSPAAFTGDSRKWLSRGDMRRMKPVMRAWARRASKRRSTDVDHGANSPHVVERLLSRIKREQDEGNPVAKLSTQHYNLLIEAWCRRGGRESALQAEALLLNEPNFIANSNSINMVVKTWVKVADDDDDEKSLHHIQKLLKLAEDTGLASLRGYNLYLSTLHRTASAEQAEIVLERMRKHKISPDVNSYCQCILALAKTGGKASAKRAQRLFQELKDSKSLTPNVDTFNAMINCYNRSVASPSTLRNVRQLLDEMDVLYQCGGTEHGAKNTTPNLTTINTALTVFAKDKTLNSVKFAEELFNKAESIYGVELDTLSYNLMIKMLSEVGTPQAIKKNIRLLDKMEKRFRTSQFGSSPPSPMPDARTYVSVINSIACCSISRARGIKAEEILNRMDTLHRNSLGAKPTAEVFNAVINAWAVSGDRVAVKKATALLKKMEERSEAGEISLRPTRKTYNLILKAYMTQGQGGDAESLLERMVQAHADGNKDLAPDCYSFTTVISAYARSKSNGKASNAMKILHQMSESYIADNALAKPNVQAFNACLNACAYTSSSDEKIEAFLVAVSTFLLLEKYTKPDHVTYATLLKAISKLIPRGEDRRRQVVAVIFNRCCRDGLVSSFVLQQLEYAASPALYHKLLQPAVKDIPHAWRRNVSQES